eukprot:SAG31_NODE_465_length_15313_cov_10.762390_3_plen_101_part_00
MNSKFVVMASRDGKVLVFESFLPFQEASSWNGSCSVTVHRIFCTVWSCLTAKCYSTVSNIRFPIIIVAIVVVFVYQWCKKGGGRRRGVGDFDMDDMSAML